MRETWAFSREPQTQPPGMADVVGEHELHPVPHLSVPHVDPGGVGHVDPGVGKASTTFP